MNYNANLKEQSFNFAVKIIAVYQHISESKKDFLLSKKLVKSATSIGASINEAVLGISNKDFLQHINEAFKDSQETEYWLRLLYKTNYLSEKEFKSIYNDCIELIKMLSSIIESSKVKPLL